MIFKLERTSDDCGSPEPHVKNAKVYPDPDYKDCYLQTIEINSLEDLRALQKEAKAYDPYVELIVNFHDYKDASGTPTIEIYDTWRE